MIHTAHKIHPFSADPDFDYEIRCALGRSGGDPGEILSAVAGVRKGDSEGWYSAWWNLAERTFATAAAAAAGEHRVSAADAYLSAASYYAVAVNAASALKESDRLAPAFARQQEAWRGFIAHVSAKVGVEVEEVGIPYEGRHLTGWFFRAVPQADAAGTARAAGATIVAVNGSDGSDASLWSACAAPALERGYNVLIFDGPGQQSELFERGVPFRPDWEHVLTPVYDFLCSLGDSDSGDNHDGSNGNGGVDRSRIAVYGISQGGYWTARALAFEHRFAAAITDPGVVDISTSWTSHLPQSLLRLLDEGEHAKFDREMAFGLKFSAAAARTWQFRARPYGTKGYAETIEAVRQYNVTDVAGQITTPLLILSPEDEQFWPGQAEQLADLTRDVSTLVRFTEAEGAAGHCQPLARALTAQRMFDWLDERLAR
ncbi:MAG: alpha/beta hydrolase family protein [Leucobacter sp.]